MSEPLDDGLPNSWLLMIHIFPIPEDDETQAMFDASCELVDKLLPGYKADVAAVYASKVEVINLEDLDKLETIEDLGFAST